MPSPKRPCIVCGKPTIGERCRYHNAQKEMFLSLERTRDDDRELIATFKRVGVKSEVARIYGVSRAAIQERLAKAQERERMRREVDEGEEITLVPIDERISASAS